jgi:NDP-sugar pyrophosphorylase family protein
VSTRGGRVADIIESETHDTRRLVSTNLFSLDVRIFQHEMAPKSKGSEEYGLPQTALAASRTLKIPFELVQTSSWIQITSPEDLQNAKKLLHNIET